MNASESQYIHQRIVELQKTGTPAVLVTVIRTIGSAPRKAGAKMLVTATGETIGTVGGAAIERLAIEKAKEVLTTGVPCIESYNLNDAEGTDTRMICGGSAELFFESVVTAPWLYMFGAGHCGKAIADLAYRAGFNCVIADNRPELTTRERFAYAAEIHCLEPADAASHIIFREPMYVVIATYCFEMDVAAARAVVRRGMPRYMGIIGSKKKRVEMRNALADLISDEQFDALHLPMGLDIGAETPEEIAVSVVAEMIRVRRKVEV